MACPREHIDGGAGNGSIALPDKEREIAGERAGISGYVNDPLRLHPGGVG